MNRPPLFSKWRRRFWPIKRSELYKFLPLLLLKFCVSFNYAILYATKDTLIVTAQGSGAEAIPILKGWVVLSAAFLFMLAYSKLSNKLSVSKLFYVVLIPFLLFFSLYGFVLYPHREALNLDTVADKIRALLGEERSHWAAVIRYWMDSLFFIVAELWGGVVIGLLFWGFANRISSYHEASRFYTLLSAGGHLGVIASGPLIWYYSHVFAAHEFHYTIQAMMGWVSVITLAMIGIYYWMNNTLSTCTEEGSRAPSGLSLKEGLFHVLKSPTLGCIALMVIGYGLSVNMIEVLWKATLKIHYPHAKDYQAFMGIVSSLTGFVSLILAVFVGGNVLRKFGWHLSAQITPLILGLSSAAFLIAYFWGGLLETGIALVVIIGALHSIACKSMKYCLFDPTKEMAYLSLDEETKVKGKAAVDVVAARFGKSGSSWIQIGLMEIASTSSVLSLAPYLAPFILLSLLAWSGAVSWIHSRATTQEKVMA